VLQCAQRLSYSKRRPSTSEAALPAAQTRALRVRAFCFVLSTSWGRHAIIVRHRSSPSISRAPPLQTPPQTFSVNAQADARKWQGRTLFRTCADIHPEPQQPKPEISTGH
jgi:hypothetical protein